MSPVFRHGRLRLYLLKLLDESPRHGYEVIRLLQDRFMGVYSPSPGTIYPRLARLEEEGLVTHDESDGRKVYRITDKGRAELRSRSGDLTELEDELTASVRDIAREVTEDVRETVRSRRGWPGPSGSSGWADPRTYRDLERLARHFTREMRTAAWNAQAVSESALGDLRAILDDALDRIKGEVFGEGSPKARGKDPEENG
jgi:DNA-binding PadR family transcriptional regulator